MQKVSFGTSGHRGIIGESFTNNHVEAISYAIATLLKKQTLTPKCVIGFDPRTGNDANLSDGSFTKTCIETLNKFGVETISYNEPVPTPLISWAISHFNYDGGLILTASHNPKEYNGLKFNPKNGAPAPQSITKEIELLANTFLLKKPEINHTLASHQTLSAPLKEFSSNLTKNVEKIGIQIPKEFSKSLTVDVKHGACANTWKELANQLGLNITVINPEPKSDFNNIEPNPTKYDHLPAANNTDYFICGNDPDGDRHAVLSKSKSIISPEEITTIIADYLLEQKKPVTSITSTVASSHIIKEVCSQNNIAYNETAVGFKFFAPYLSKANQSSEISLAVESSGGFSSSYHTLEKCGFYPIICLIAILENKNITIDQAKGSILKKYKTRHFKETTFDFQPTQKELLNTFFSNTTKTEIQSLLEHNIKEINQIDGLKIVVDKDNWVLLRLSGTEPLCRVYSESSSDENGTRLISKITQILSTKIN